MASTLNLDRELGPHLASELEDALFSTFQAYLFVADSQVSPADAAQQIDSLITDHDDRAGFLHTFWEMYFRFGCQVDGAEPVYRLKMASESEGDKSQRTLGRHCPSWDRIWWSDGIWPFKYLLMNKYLPRPEIDPQSVDPGSEPARRWHNMNNLLVQLEVIAEVEASSLS